MDESGGLASAALRRNLDSPTVANWELWRQDDHGNEFRVRDFEDRDAAERARDELIARGHHQHYWIVQGGTDEAAVEA